MQRQSLPFSPRVLQKETVHLTGSHRHLGTTKITFLAKMSLAHPKKKGLGRLLLNLLPFEKVDFKA